MGSLTYLNKKQGNEKICIYFNHTNCVNENKNVQSQCLK